MKILVYMGHPAHFHLFKNSIVNWKNHGHRVFIVIKKKDVLEDLLKDSGFEYTNILSEGRKDSKTGILIGLIKRIIRMYLYCLKYKPDILTGTSVENSYVGKLLKIPVVNVNEDDANVVPFYAKLSYPLATSILNPDVCSSGKWNKKAVKYHSLHEVAYLHPAYFTPDIEILRNYNLEEKKYILIRFAKLTAHHDTGIRGINNETALLLIRALEPFGKVIINSERELNAELEKYRLNIHSFHMHHILAFSKFFIGDSQTMSAEAGVLGVPFIRYNDFVNKIGYLKDLEEGYHAGVGISPDNPDILLKTVVDILQVENVEEKYKMIKQTILKEKIDLTKFITWYIEEFPLSNHVMKTNPDYQYIFK